MTKTSNTSTASKGWTLAICLMACLGLGTGLAPNPAQALVVNDKIEISRKALKKKCQRAGGTYISHKKSYECRHAPKGGGLVIIECKNNMKCFGYSMQKTKRDLQPTAPGSFGATRR